VGVHDSGVQRRRLLQSNVRAQGLSKAHHEPHAKVIDRAFTLEKSELTDRAVGERQPEPDLNELDEVIPGQRRVLHLLVLGRATHAELPLAAVQPRQWVADAVKLRKFDLVRCLVPGGAGVGVAVRATAPGVVLLAASAVIPRRRDKVVLAIRRGCRRVVPWTCCSSQMRDTLSPCCCCLTSRTSLVTAWTNSYRRSSREVMSSATDSFPEPEPVGGGMVGRLGLSDTRLSQVGKSAR
jgi:hypothetical protein